MKTYSVNEIFFSLQGEGVRAGTANLFLRFAGCNQMCTTETHGFDCDTDFASGRPLTLPEIVAELRQAVADACAHWPRRLTWLHSPAESERGTPHPLAGRHTRGYLDVERRFRRTQREHPR